MVKKETFGVTLEGQGVDLFTLTNTNGIEVQFCTYGGIITAIKTPDKQGRFADIVLGFDTLKEYIRHNPYFGCLVGRYGNRIAKGRFELQGKSYTLAQNNYDNHLHGGIKGFDKVVWEAEILGAEVPKKRQAVKLSYLSPDGEEGYPGNLKVEVIYSLTEDNAFRIDYQAITDETTIINLTNHSYFNLSGAADILGHELMLNAEKFIPIDKTFIPKGDLKDVMESPFDFRDSTLIGKRIFTKDEQLEFADGYDHNWVLKRTGEGLGLAARVTEASTGRQLEVFTTQPGVQFYSGNMLPDLQGKNGQTYQKHAGFCLETQHFPDSPNQASFPSVVLNPNETYKHSTVFKFSVV